MMLSYCKPSFARHTKSLGHRHRNSRAFPAAFSRSQRSVRTPLLPACTAQHQSSPQTSFEDVKFAAEKAHARACELFPALENAQRVARDAREPAAEAERQFVESHSQLAEVSGKAHSAIAEVRDGAEAALGGAAVVTSGLLRHHARSSLETARPCQTAEEPLLWQRFAPEIKPLEWLPGAMLLTQVAACLAEDEPSVVACIAVAMPMLSDNLRSILLHWSVADGPAAGWCSFIPEGWHTSPALSQPCGSSAWETTFAPHAPVIDGSAATSAVVFSVVVQIPMEGFLEERGGLKFVLKRTDGGQPEWIKPSNNADFWLDFARPIALFRSCMTDGTEAVSANDILDASTNLEPAFASAASNEPGCAHHGWLQSVDKWEVVPDYPPQQPASLSRQVQQLRGVLSAAAARPWGAEGDAERAQRAEQVQGLLWRCQEVDGTLQLYDAASLKARVAQHEKERLWEEHKNAADEASRLQSEVAAAVEAARRGAVLMRGRTAEVTQRDLEAVAAQLAGAGGTSEGIWPFNALLGTGRRLAFVSQSAGGIAGLEATLVVQVHLEGKASDVTAALAQEKLEGESSKKPLRLPFDTVVVSVAAAESFPTNGLRSPLLLHFGAVIHQNDKWRAPPEGWRSQPAEEMAAPTPGAPSLPMVPMQLFSTIRKDGSAAFVDPQMYGACMRFPLDGLVAAKLRGLEFVLACEGRWLQPANGGNFHVALPLV